MVEWVQYCGLSKFYFGTKIEGCESRFKKVDKEEFGDLAFRKKNLLIELMGLDAREELVGLLNDEQIRQIQLKGDIKQLASLEEISWRQNFRALYVK